MSLASVKTLINDEIATNGSNAITAAVLNPVLQAMVDQINDLVGAASGLPNPYTDVISALNGITPQNIQIHTGTADPNVTPPSSFGVGDFYTQTLSSIIFAFWQYNGIIWVEVLSRQQQKIRNYKAITGSYAVLPTDDVIVYNGASISDTVTLPSPSTNVGRVLVIANISEVEIITSTYLDIEFAVQEEIIPQSSIQIISYGAFWQQINNKKNDI